MKILMLIDSLVKGGRERRLIELLKGFKKYSDIEVALVLFSKRIDYPEIYHFNIPIYYLERNPKKDPSVFWRLFKLCRKEKPDIIHSWGTMPSVYAIPSAKFLGIKFINASIANAPDQIGWRNKDYLRSKLTYPFCDMVIGNSKAGLSAYEAPANKSHCVYNGFDFGRLQDLKQEQDVRRKYNIPAGLITGMVGAFYDRKDYETYIKAAVRFLDTRRDMTFLGIGDGPNLDKIKSLVPEQHRDRILFPGLIDDVESLVNIFDIGVLATFTEGISNAILEYMVLAKPVIASEGGGTNELVIEQETGYLIRSQDPVMLEDRLRRLADHPELRVAFGANGKLRIHKYFTLDQMQKEYYRLYKSLLSNEQIEAVSYSN